MNFFDQIKNSTEGWKIKTFLKPLYLPWLLKFKYYLQNRNFKIQGGTVLKSANNAFQEIGLFYWLEFGTLLGVVRDGKLIEHDTDIDVGVFLTDYSAEIEKSLLKHGFVKTRKFEIEGGYGIEESYELKGVNFDIFYFTKYEEGIYCHLFPDDGEEGHLIRELHSKIKEFKKIDWQGNLVHIPKDSDQRLRDTYGDYTIRIKEWNTPNDALNSKIIDKKFKVTKY